MNPIKTDHRKMEEIEMRRSSVLRCKKILSGFLAFTIASVLVLGDAGVALADGWERFLEDGSALADDGRYSAATASNARFSNRKEDEVTIGVISRDSDYRAGGEVCLEVHIKNESRTAIRAGELSFKGQGMEEGTAGFEEEGISSYEKPEEEPGTASDGELEEEPGTASDGELEEEPGTASDGELEEEPGTASAEEPEEEPGTVSDGELEEELRAASYEVLETATGSDALPGGEEGDGPEGWEEAEEGEEDAKAQKLEGISIEPGEVYSAYFSFTISEDEERSRNHSVKFQFKGQAGDRRVNRQEKFLYAVNSLNVDVVEFEDGNCVKTGEDVTLGIRSSMFDFELGLKDSQVSGELEELEKATPSSAGEEEESGEADGGTAGKPEKATPSSPPALDFEDRGGDTEEESKPEAGESAPDIETAEEEKTEEETSASGQIIHEESEEEEDTVDLGGASYEIEMFNARLNGFTARKALAESPDENILACSFRVSADTEPGIYFGKVTQKIRYEGRTYRSTQGFSLIVEGDGEIELHGSLGALDVTVSGPAEAFPDAQKLELQISRPTLEQQEAIDRAVERRAMTGTSIENRQAVDIKLLADGRECGVYESVRVAFDGPQEKEPQKATASNGEAVEATASNGEAVEPVRGERAVYLFDEESGDVVPAQTQGGDGGRLEVDAEKLSVYLLGEEKANGNYAYVSSIEMGEVLDGSAPFDKSNAPGNDSAADNHIVRSFDSITYNVEVSMMPLGNENSYTEGTLHFKAELPADITEAKFDLSKMLWLGDSYTISYYDENGTLLSSGKGGEPDYTANGHADEYYRTPVKTQVLEGSYSLAGEKEGEVVIPGTKNLSVGVQVTAAENGDEIHPTFTVWLGDNEENHGREGETVKNSIQPELIRVTAAPRYNVELTKTSQLTYLGDFDLATGQEVETPTETSVHGRMLGYGVILQLYNETDSEESGAIAAKGLRGIELPRGEISMTVKLKTEKSSGKPIENITGKRGYVPVLWDYNENISASKGGWGRNLYWNNVATTKYACWYAPLSRWTGAEADFAPDKMSCYYGGKWEMDPGQKETDPAKLPEGQAENTYEIQVSGFDFDLDGFVFPQNNTGNAGVITKYTSYVGCFSAGYLEAIMCFPEDIEETQSLYFTVEVTDFKKAAEDGQAEETEEINLSDNRKSADITLYPGGSFTKYNSFTAITSGGYSSQFLGSTNYWLKSSDASSFAGEEILMWGAAVVGRDTETPVYAVNILQKFDSEAFEIIEDSEKPRAVLGNNSKKAKTGETRVLFGADPQNPEGWSSNKPEDVDRMNAAREEDLIYFDSLDELEKAGYACVAVLLEVRDCELYADDYMQLRVPVKVTDDPKLIGKTYCTVNGVRLWRTKEAMDDFTWAGGTCDEESGKNSKFTEYQEANKEATEELALWEMYRQKSNGKEINYVKTEYEDVCVK